MRNARSIAGIAALATLVASGVALAAGPGREPPMRGECGHMQGAGMGMGGPGMGGMDMGMGMQAQRPSFGDLDADGNGEITRPEFEAMRTARFRQADADSDGKLTLDEMQAQARGIAEARAATMLKWLDADGDGALSAEEVPQHRGPGVEMLMRIDADGSGGISQAEFDAAKDRMAARHAQGQGGWHGRRHGAPDND